MGLFLIIQSAIFMTSKPKMSFNEFGCQKVNSFYKTLVSSCLKYKRISQNLKTNQVNSTSHNLN